MKKLRQIIFSLITIFALFVILSLIFPKLLRILPATGRGAVDEYCVECGLFQRTSYFSLFGQIFFIEHRPNDHNGLAILHDSFFTPCKEHKMHVYHVLRNSEGFYGKYIPRPTIGFEEFRYCESEKAKKLVEMRPELARRVAAGIFKQARSGKENTGFFRWKEIIEFHEMMNNQEIEQTLIRLEKELE